jgi:hypothetical protein
MFIVVISTLMVWEKCVSHVELDFLVLKLKNFSIVFRFSRKELGSKTVFKGQNQKFDEGF